MAGRNINVYTSNWRYTGSTVRIDQAAFDLEIHWTDASGAPRTWSGVVTWPNDFAFLSTAQRKAVIEELTLRIARVRLGIDGDV